MALAGALAATSAAVAAAAAPVPATAEAAAPVPADGFAPAPSLDRPIDRRSLLVSFDGERLRDPGGDALRAGSLDVRASTSLAGRVHLDRDGLEAWGLFGQAEARAFAVDLPGIAGAARFLYLDLALGLLWAPSARDDVWFQGGGFVADQVSLLGSPELHPHGSVVASHRFDRRLRVLYGFGYDYTFGRGLPLPLLGVDWSFAPAWSWTTVLPVQSVVTWRGPDGLELGGGATARGDYYQYEAQEGAARGEQALSVARIRLGVAARQQLSPSTFFRVELGVEGAQVDAGSGRRRAGGAYLDLALGLGTPSPFEEGRALGAPPVAAPGASGR